MEQETKLTPQPKTKNIVWIVIAVILLIASCALGYLLYIEKEKSSDLQTELNEKVEYINENAQVIRDAEMEPGFRPLLQERANKECIGEKETAVVFNTTTSPEKNEDGTVKKYYAVGQYFCNIGDSVVNGSIRFVAAQSYDGDNWEFTYGSGSENPVLLPGYIFNTDKNLYNRKYNNPESN